MSAMIIAQRARRDIATISVRGIITCPAVRVGEAEDAVEHLFFVLLEDARLLAGGHEHLQLCFRVHHGVAAGASQAEHVHDGAADAVQQRG